MPRITKNTPDPAWLGGLDCAFNGSLDQLRALPVIKAAKRGRLDPKKAPRFMLQIGKGIIEAFPLWLHNMAVRADDCREAKLFLRANCLEERRHWQWWQDMARHYGVRPSQFKSVLLDPDVGKLSRYLTEVSKDFRLPCAMAAINYTIETSAARLTAEVSRSMSQVLVGKQQLWIKAHATGDIVHSADARELIKKHVWDDPHLQGTVATVVSHTAELFVEALDSAYAAPIA